jgi:PAS domain S-box-containing protein
MIGRALEHHDSHSLNEVPGFLQGGGTCGALIRSIDWADSPLGPAQFWPTALKTTLAIMLNSRHPMFLWWGPELIQFYNDAYVPSFGEGKHPRAMGQEGEHCWPEIWPIISPQIRDVMERAIPSWHENQLVPIYRDGGIQEVFWTYGYSPVFDEDQRVLGTLVICQETTSAIVERRAVEAARCEADAARERLAQLFEQSRMLGAITGNLAQAVLLVRARDSTIAYANPRAETMFGFSARELLGSSITMLHANGDEAEVGLPAADTDLVGAERECVRKNGTHCWCSISTSNFDHEEHGRVWIALYTDITERKRLEQRTARALDEKEVLLREIHHRVKNNLQVVSSLFSLQRERTQSAELKRLLDESRTRVESIALVHEQLYRSADLAAIDFDAYLRSLVSVIRSTYAAEQVEIEVGARDVLLEIDQAVPCALLVCELVSNSFKHAFTTGTGKLWVHAERDAQSFCILTVGDDGRGMSADFDWKKSRSLGLRLVQGLARQLRATIALDPSSGTLFKLRFAIGGVKDAQAEQERIAIAPTRP